MEEILHQLIGSLSHYLQGFIYQFIYPKWCRISASNSITGTFGPTHQQQYSTNTWEVGNRSSTAMSSHLDEKIASAELGSNNYQPSHVYPRQNGGPNRNKSFRLESSPSVLLNNTFLTL